MSNQVKVAAGNTCRLRGLVDSHFAGRIGPADERRMREHLPGCDQCTSYYERHLLLASIDPAALSAQERLARSLGLSRRKDLLERLHRLLVVRASRPQRQLAAAASAAALLLVGGLVGHHLALRTPSSSEGARSPAAGPSAGQASPEGFTARGATSPVVGPSRVLPYKMVCEQEAEPLRGTMAVDDRLAFAYENGRSHQRLMVLGLDESLRVYWYHPAWSDPTADPEALPVQASPGVHELPEAIRHRLPPGGFRLVGLLTNEVLRVRQVERALAEQMHRLDDRLPALPGAVVLDQTVVVTPAPGEKE